jgi:hypothetical protein
MGMSQEQYIRERLEDQINWYDQRSNSNQKVYKWSKRTEILLAALIPLLAGFSPLHLPAFIIGGLGATIAVIEGVLSIGKYHENWIDYRGICETLRHEKYMFVTTTGVYKTENPFELLVERIESIISKENVNWANLNSPNTKKENSK